MANKIVIGGCVAFGFFIIVGLVIVLVNHHSDSDDWYLSQSSYFTSCASPNKSTHYGVFQKAAISSDAPECATISKNIFKKGGSTVDAAIAGVFCVCIINTQSCDLSGGFLATYFRKNESKVYALDAREVAPAKAFPEMFDANFYGNKNLTNKWWFKQGLKNLRGGLPIAVPGHLPGLYELYNKFGGKLPWRELIQPSISICERGYNLTWYTAGSAHRSEAMLLSEPSMSFLTNPAEKRVLKEGEIVKRPKLAETLRILQDDPLALQRGPLAKKFVEDIQQFGGLVTEEDLQSYRPIWREPVTMSLRDDDFKFFSFPPPGSGLLVGMLLNILDEFNLTNTDLADDKIGRTQQIMAEAMKYTFGKRYKLGDISTMKSEQLEKELLSKELASELRNGLLLESTKQDPAYYGAQMVGPADEGTAHYTVVGPDGDAIAITSTFNYGYGAGIRSEKTGIILNNEMTDFSKPPSLLKEGSLIMENNQIVPGNRPLSSMSPTIVLDKNGELRLVLGAAGGSKIVTSLAWAMARHLFMNQELEEALEACRSHHQLQPMLLQYELGFSKDWLNDLQTRGHVTSQMISKSVITAVARINNQLISVSDFRKSGDVDGF